MRAAMSKPLQPILRSFIKLHETNYGLFKARSEKELATSIQTRSNLAVPFCLLLVYETGLELVFSTTRAAQKAIQDIKKSCDISATEMARCFSEIRQKSLLKPNLPSPAFFAIFTKAGCNTMAIIPAIEDVVTVGVICLGASEGQIEKKLIAPIVNLAETIPTCARKHQSCARHPTTPARTGSNFRYQPINLILSDLQELYEVLHKQIKETIGDVSFAVSLFDAGNRDHRNALYVRQTSQSDGIIEPFPIGEGLISILIRTRQPLMLVDDTERRAARWAQNYRQSRQIVDGMPAGGWRRSCRRDDRAGP
jgi:hypothetical protein